MNRSIVSAIAIMFIAITCSIASAEVELKSLGSLSIGATPVDVAVDDRGRTMVLTNKGEVLIYSANRILDDRIPVGPSIDRLEISKSGDKLYLMNKKKGTVDIVHLEYTLSFSEDGSPVKGAANAPVVIMVFNDFQ